MQDTGCGGQGWTLLYDTISSLQRHSRESGNPCFAPSRRDHLVALNTISSIACLRLDSRLRGNDNTQEWR
jgi:hypothetical protein